MGRTNDNEMTPARIEGVDVLPYGAVVARLSAHYPELSVTEVEAIVQREHDAFTGGRPIVVPVEVESGAVEIIQARAHA